MREPHGWNIVISKMYIDEHAAMPLEGTSRLIDDPDDLSLITGARILVVDDDIDFVRAVTLRLGAAGYQVSSAPNAELALRSAITSRPDLVLLDIGLPTSSGHTLALQLTNNVASIGVPFIYVTGRRGTSDKDYAFKLGALDYIVKPFTTERLLQGIARALSGEPPLANDAEIS